ncbi:YhcN/YlaJ family sporulation lipoprotein [Paenibacillus oleatilyticus]|uniref:YhcN/YlaJ family sporulation lipoprotein n=1 Tax=Paenibacillus oleatilyticus TaxID=2594886 RepID=UPI001C20103C|nr:YhcN/YlaJ family sporulation lipoprotein [Paenibacillus oleatilyticus]MBU7318745.1 YhcN/YlaJ family sporulation lipoprotein [Paenibacillus oleatilyticus]
MNTAIHRKGLLLLAVAGCLLLQSACGGNRPQASRPGGGLEDYRQQALYDRDSRNNEDGSLGVKQRWVDEQQARQGKEYSGRKQLDMTNRHSASTMAFAPQIAERVKGVSGVREAQVLLTEVNGYVAVVLDGHSPEAEASPDMLGYQVTSKGGVGIFGGTDKGPNRYSWTENGGLSTGKADEIRKLAMSMAPTNIQQVYVSANPNFVQRVRFYAKEEKERGTMTNYMNEFNTLVLHVFPDDANTRK